MLLMLFVILFGGVISSHPVTYITYNHIALMSLRSRSRDKASMVVTRADHLYSYIII